MTKIKDVIIEERAFSRFYICFINLVVCSLLFVGVAKIQASSIPVIYDDFSDGKLQNRTGTDPWGEKLPEWNVSGTWDASSEEAQTDDGEITISCNVTAGTWKFRYRYLSAPPTSDYTRGSFMKFIVQSNASSLQLNNPTDGHWWLDYWATGEINDGWPRASQSYPYINMVGSCIGGGRVAGTAWHDVVFIRDDNGYVGTWLDGAFVEYSRDRNLDISDNTLFSLRGYNLAGYTFAVDDIEVYDGVFLIPNKNISYDGITITVNDYDVTLNRIADSVSNPAVFDYNSLTNTAICYADILIKSGAEFQITNGILKMDSGKKIKYEREAMIFLDEVTITSTGSSPWYWEHSGSSSYGAIVLSVINSTINNCGGFTSGGMKTLYLKDSQFTSLVGSQPFSIYFRRPPNGELLISGCLFQGSTGTETIFFQGGDQFHQLKPEPYGMDVIDTVFENVEFFRHYDYPYYLSPGRPGGTANLTNVKVYSLGYNGSFYRFKYYLDVKVVDKNGTPVSGATVTVVNEQDNIDYSSENLFRSWKYLKVEDQVSAGGEDYFTGQQGNWFKGLVDENNCSSAITEINGHTPLPSNIMNTLVLINNGVVISNPTYAVNAEKDGYTATVTGIDPDENWYRENPNSYPGLDKGTVVVELPMIIETDATGDDENRGLNENLGVFPNPYVKSKNVNEKISFNNLYPGTTIKIYTISGKLIKTIKHNDPTGGGSEEWNISGVASGMYIYCIESAEGKKTGKVSIIK